MVRVTSFNTFEDMQKLHRCFIPIEENSVLKYANWLSKLLSQNLQIALLLPFLFFEVWLKSNFYLLWYLTPWAIRKKPCFRLLITTLAFQVKDIWCTEYDFLRVSIDEKKFITQWDETRDRGIKRRSSNGMEIKYVYRAIAPRTYSTSQRMTFALCLIYPSKAFVPWPFQRKVLWLGSNFIIKAYTSPGSIEL